MLARLSLATVPQLINRLINTDLHPRIYFPRRAPITDNSIFPSPPACIRPALGVMPAAFALILAQRI